MYRRWSTNQKSFPRTLVLVQVSLAYLRKKEIIIINIVNKANNILGSVSAFPAKINFLNAVSQFPDKSSVFFWQHN